jgi:GNAT superfamily N-acetyltransferase
MAHPTGSVPIRALRPEDLPSVADVIDATGLFPSELLADMAAPFLAGGADGSLWLVAEGASGRVEGIAYTVPERLTQGTFNMLLLAVDPNRQRTGTGAALVAATQERLAADGGRLLLVETSGLSDFEGPRRFYARCGFVQEARIRGFYAPGEDKVVFRKDLAPQG